MIKMFGCTFVLLCVCLSFAQGATRIAVLNATAIEEDNDDAQLMFPKNIVIIPSATPWFASVRAAMEPSQPEQPLCTASLITDRHILGTQSCLGFVPADQLKVFLGAYYLPLVDLHLWRKSSPVRHVYAHPQHDLWNNDLAVAQLDCRLPFDRFISPIHLPNADQVPSASDIVQMSHWDVPKCPHPPCSHAELDHISNQIILDKAQCPLQGVISCLCQLNTTEGVCSKSAVNYDTSGPVYYVRVTNTEHGPIYTSFLYALPTPVTPYKKGPLSRLTVVNSITASDDTMAWIHEVVNNYNKLE